MYPEGWENVNNKLEKTFKLKDFKAVLEVVMKIGFEAEYRNHHPEWTNSYNILNIKLCTHDAGHQITEKDTNFALKINSIINQ